MNNFNIKMNRLFDDLAREILGDDIDYQSISWDGAEYPWEDEDYLEDVA